MSEEGFDRPIDRYSLTETRAFICDYKEQLLASDYYSVWFGVRRVVGCYDLDNNTNIGQQLARVSSNSKHMNTGTQFGWSELESIQISNLSVYLLQHRLPFLVGKLTPNSDDVHIWFEGR